MNTPQVNASGWAQAGRQAGDSFAKIAEKHGIDLDTLLDQVNIPLAKVAKKAGADSKQTFLDECEDAGIVETSDERHCVATQ